MTHASMHRYLTEHKVEFANQNSYYLQCNLIADNRVALEF